MGVVEAGRLAFEVGEEVVAEVELDLARGADDDLAGDVEEDGGERGDEQQAQRVVEDLGFGDAVLHVVDGVADDEREQDADDVVEDDRDASPGEVLPVALEVGNEWSEFLEHIDSFCGLRSDEVRGSEDAALFQASLGLWAVARLQGLADSGGAAGGFAGVAAGICRGGRWCFGRGRRVETG